MTRDEWWERTKTAHRWHGEWFAYGDMYDERLAGFASGTCGLCGSKCTPAEGWWRCPNSRKTQKDATRIEFQVRDDMLVYRNAQGWFACEFPEREPDAEVRWHPTDCRLCSFKADVQLHRFPDDETLRRILGPIASAS